VALRDEGAHEAGLTMKILAIASGGGHWEQLMLMRPAFEGASVMYVTTLVGLPERAGISDFAYIDECNRNSPGKIASEVLRIFRIIWQFKPDVVVSTGALPGLIGIAVAKLLFRKRTMWIDSIANGQEFSMSGRYARYFADLRLSQWESVAAAEGAQYRGSII
jgi:hypothetical protein